MEVILMRHSRTAGNAERRYVGRTDEPLSPEGIELARLTGIDGSVPKVYVSPMRRAVETARIKFPNAALTPADGLREMDFGDFEGRTADEMSGDTDYAVWLESGCTLRCPNGEQMDEFSARVNLTFESIVRTARDSGEKKLVIVAHGGTLMAILAQYGQPARVYYEWYVDNCCGYKARLDALEHPDRLVLTDCEKFETLP